MPFRLSRRALLASAAVAPALLLPESPAQTALSEHPVLPPLPADQVGGSYAGLRFELQYLFDEDDAEIAINDFRMASAERGVAACVCARKGRDDHFVLLTRDGGRKWTPVKIRDFPLSLCHVDESRIFLVGRDNLWFSDEGGLTWQKRKLPRAGEQVILRVSFLNDKHGWAFGAGKTFWTTEDGGLNWAKVPESEKLALTSRNTAWSWMSWVSPQVGMLVGSSQAPTADSASRFPDWMMPERATRRRLLPSTTAMAETRDGGKTWKTSVASTFGRVNRVRTSGTLGVAVSLFGEGVEFPAEVYTIDLSTGKSSLTFRRKDVFIYDAAPLPSGGFVVAGIEPPGRMRNSPVPGKLKVFMYRPGSQWVELKTDYRATGRRAVLATVDDNNIWVATDEGAILRLVRKQS